MSNVRVADPRLSITNRCSGILIEPALTKTTKKNFINKQITLQKHYPRIAGLFEAGQCVQNMKLR